MVSDEEVMRRELNAARSIPCPSSYGHAHTIELVLKPFYRRIGQRWRSSTILAAARASSSCTTNPLFFKALVDRPELSTAISNPVIRSIKEWGNNLPSGSLKESDKVESR